MRHSEAPRPKQEEVSQEEKPKFDLEQEAAAKNETEAVPSSQFAVDMNEYREIGDKLAKKGQEKLHVREASEALGTGSRAAEKLAESIDSEIAELNQKRQEMISGYPDGGKDFLEGMAAIDKLSGELAKKEAKLKQLEQMDSFIDYPGGERGAKAEIVFLKEGVEKAKADLKAEYEKNAGLERSTEPSSETAEALADLRQIEADRVAGEKAAAREARIKAMGERVDAAMAKEDAEAAAAEGEEPILLTPDMQKPIEVTDDMIVSESPRELLSADNSDAQALAFDAFSEMKPITDQEIDAAVKTKQLSPERQAALNKAIDFLEGRIFEIEEGLERVVQTKKADGSVETKTIDEPGTKELAKTIKEKYGVDIQAQNDATAVSTWKRLGFGLKKLFNPGLGRLVSEHNRKESVAADLKGEITDTKALMKDPGKWRQLKQDSSLKMFALRQRMKRPGPVVNVKVR